MTTVLIALDASDEAHAAAAAAHRIFGDGAEYLAINVAPLPLPADTFAWGSVFGYPYPPVVPAVTDEAYSGDVSITARAEAAQLATEAGIDDAQPLGDVGDPVTAIVEAAEEHHVDVIVAGWHDRSFLARMFEPSVTNDLIKRTSVPVLVVPVHRDERTERTDDVDRA
jgi:nucleotide-binding universal stress UspA family protein